MMEGSCTLGQGGTAVCGKLQPHTLGTQIEVLKCQSKGSGAAALHHTWSGMHMGLAKAEAVDYYNSCRLKLSITVRLAMCN